MRTAAAVIALAVLLLPGCQAPQYAQVRPERLYERWPGDQTAHRKVGALDITMRGWGILGIPVATPNLVASIDAQIQDENADAVINLQIKQEETAVALFYWGTYHATGDLIVFE